MESTQRQRDKSDYCNTLLISPALLGLRQRKSPSTIHVFLEAKVYRLTMRSFEPTATLPACPSRFSCRARAVGH
jgi:hypothetical protein